MKFTFNNGEKVYKKNENQIYCIFKKIGHKYKLMNKDGWVIENLYNENDLWNERKKNFIENKKLAHSELKKENLMKMENLYNVKKELLPFVNYPSENNRSVYNLFKEPIKKIFEWVDDNEIVVIYSYKNYAVYVKDYYGTCSLCEGYFHRDTDKNEYTKKLYENSIVFSSFNEARRTILKDKYIHPMLKESLLKNK